MGKTKALKTIEIGEDEQTFLSCIAEAKKCSVKVVFEAYFKAVLTILNMDTLCGVIERNIDQRLKKAKANARD